MKPWVVLFPVLLLSGCAGSPLGNLLTNQRYQTTSDITASWVGASEDDLVTSWGAPKNSYALSDGYSKIIGYDYVWLTNASRSAEWGYVPDYARCEQRFMIERGMVTRWYSSGDCPKRPSGAKLIPASTPVPKPTL
ncbi:hypothetical protein RRX38_20030 [Pseudomonas sp. DTU_2021_1001937_2_SI_NGA_ILE_001]|uniref:hypothetical protein n=1 Tax=Pseudomonas sp. DTU_2021_1001937_2_SI_NGA_ILE_001 TaxID=3077589 RepID=UPI0025EDD94D|nr:hypothetical protein [Pseudomonas sp. DTU_2021_1001937_2_SI_NGA_ILE_001]WNW13352.1 hypothetical protein RRX38_20030 [Pseudomonas sp. DTU_2021_1001937_2_SI_NGA_ILE_001]